MLKKAIMLAMGLVLLILLSASCGGGGKEDLAPLTSEINQLKTELQTMNAELEVANSKLIQAKNLMEFVTGYIIPSITGEFADKGQPEMLALLAEWQVKANAMGDSVLAQKFQTMINVISGAGGTAPGTAQTMVQDMFTYLIDALDKVLE